MIYRRPTEYDKNKNPLPPETCEVNFYERPVVGLAKETLEKLMLAREIERIEGIWMIYQRQSNSWIPIQSQWLT